MRDVASLAVAILIAGGLALPNVVWAVAVGKCREDRNARTRAYINMAVAALIVAVAIHSLSRCSGKAMAFEVAFLGGVVLGSVLLCLRLIPHESSEVSEN